LISGQSGFAPLGPQPKKPPFRITPRPQCEDRTVRDDVDPSPYDALLLVSFGGPEGPDDVLPFLENVTRGRGIPPERLAEVLCDMGTRGRKGAGRVRRWLDVRGDGPALQRELEVVTARKLFASALPPPTRQHRVYVDGEPYDLDFAWPERMVALECDGWGSHGGRQAFESDRVRWAAVESVGWRIIPVTWREIRQRPERILRRVEVALRS
jgi:very-short-patch-repair endonuclease